MGRPLAEPRQVLQKALQAMPGAATFHAVAQNTGLPERLVRNTLRNMARVGQAVEAGRAKVPGTNRPAVMYAAPEVMRQQDSGRDLQAAIRGWVSTF